MTAYTHHKIAHGKALAEAFSLALAFSDRISHKSFFWYPNRPV